MWRILSASEDSYAGSSPCSLVGPFPTPQHDSQMPHSKTLYFAFQDTAEARQQPRQHTAADLCTFSGP